MSKQDKIRNEEIRRCGVADITEKTREARLRWFEHVMRRKEEESSRIAMEMEVEGTRSRGRPKNEMERVC